MTNGPPLGAILYGRDADGKRIHSDDDVAYALPLLVFVVGIPPSSLPPPVQNAFLRGCQQCGLTGDEEPEQIGALIGKAYSERPIEPKLAAVLDAWARTGLADAQIPDVEKKKLESFLGVTSKRGVLGGDERPAGTTPAGPLARFAVATRKT